MKDLFNLETIEHEEIKFRRFKTSQLFNVKIEPEVYELFERYKGKRLLLNFCDTIVHHDNFRRKVNEYLDKIVAAINEQEVKNKSKFKMREFTTYGARHSWASFAGELDIPDKDISMALGHESQGNTTTAIYIKYNHLKVIAANRKVIEYVHGRISPKEREFSIPA